MSRTAGEEADDAIVRLLLGFARDPLRGGRALQAAFRRPRDFDRLLRLALRHTAASSSRGDTEGDNRLARSAAAFVRASCFRDSATHYDLLGIAPGAASETLQRNYRLLMQLVHPDRSGADRWPADSAARLNRAYAVLRDPSARASYDRRLAETAARSRPADHRSGVGDAPAADTPNGGRSGRAGPIWWSHAVAIARAHPLASGLAAILVVVAPLAAAVLLDAPDENEGMTMRSPAAGANLLAVSPVAVRAPGLGSATATAGVPAAGGAPAPTLRAQGLSEPRPLFVRATMAASLRTACVDALGGAAPGPESSEARSPSALAFPCPSVPPGTAPSADGSIVRPREPLQWTLPSASAAPEGAEVLGLMARLVSAYEGGNGTALARLFDQHAVTNAQAGRPAIRRAYDELFRLTAWRRMDISRLDWQASGDRTVARAMLGLRIGWPDGSQTRQSLVMHLELVRRGDDTVIARLAHRAQS